jgi:hypothetical protein
VLSLYARGMTHWGDFGTFRSDLWGVGVEGDDQPDHRQGDPGDDHLGQSAPQAGAVSRGRSAPAGAADDEELWAGLVGASREGWTGPSCSCSPWLTLLVRASETSGIGMSSVEVECRA